jgi:hypothetical protein
MHATFPVGLIILQSPLWLHIWLGGRHKFRSGNLSKDGQVENRGKRFAMAVSCSLSGIFRLLRTFVLSTVACRGDYVRRLGC